MKSYSFCPVCNGSSFQLVLQAKDYLVSGDVFDIYECAECTLRFTNPIPDESEIIKYYQSDAYISHSSADRDPLFEKAYKIARGLALKSKFNLISRETGFTRGELLDVGCGTGEFLNYFKLKEWNVVGIEPDDEARQKAKNQYQLDVWERTKLYEFESNSFDVITLWHVLEHVHELHTYLAKLKEILKPGGALIFCFLACFIIWFNSNYIPFF